MIQNEPALSVGGFVAVINAAADLIAAFGFDLSSRQLAAIDGFLTIFLVFLGSWLIRQQVTPVEKLAQLLGIFPAQPVVPTPPVTPPVTPPPAP